MTTLREVNKALEKMGVQERLFKGKHYYYFGEKSLYKPIECVYNRFMVRK